MPRNSMPLFKHQKTSIKFMQQAPRVLDTSDPGCVSADTEFLTPIGWKPISEYEKGDRVAQFNPTTKDISWVDPEEYVKAPCDEMIAIAPVRGTSQRLSGEHRVLYYTADGQHHETSATSFMEHLHTKGAAHSGRKFATSFRVSHKNTLPLTTAHIRLMVAVIADGHFAHNGTACTVRLKKQRKIERLRSLLCDAEVPYVERRCGGDSSFHVFRFTPRRTDKFFGAWWWQASQAQLYTIADELPHWDGSDRKAGSTSFCSTIRASSEFAQYAFSATGNTASLAHTVRDDKTDTYDVHVVRGQEFVGPGRASSVTIVDNPEGFKYCFSVPTTYWLARHNGHIFATGNTGKTRVEIELFAGQRKNGGGCALVIAPKSLLRSAWQDDFIKFAPHVTTVVANAANRAKAFAEDVDVYITNTDAAKWLAQQKPAFFKKFDTLIIDEISSFKHATSQRSKAMNKIKKHFKYRRGLTGTPTSNSITDIWHPVFLLDDGQRLGKSFFQFRASVCTPKQVGPQPNMVQWVDKESAELAVGHLLGDMVIRHKFEECLDIPENHMYSVPYHMPAKQMLAYKQMEDVALSELASGQIIAATNAAVVMGKLLQIASGAAYTGATESDRSYATIDTGRYELIADLTEQRDHSIVFFNWVHQRDELVKEFEKRGITFVVIDGKTSDNDRKNAVDMFQAGFYRVLLAHPQSAAHGLTLTKGTATIWASPTHNLEHFVQGNRRIYRAGQKLRTETIVVLAADTIEAKVFAALQTKDAKQTSMLDLLKDLSNSR